MIDPGYAARAYTPLRVAVLPPDVFVVVDQVGDNDPAQGAALGQQISGDMVRHAEQALRARGLRRRPVVALGRHLRSGRGDARQPRGDGRARQRRARLRQQPGRRRRRRDDDATAGRARARVTRRLGDAVGRRALPEREGRGRDAGQAHGERPRRRVLRRHRRGGDPGAGGVVEGRRQLERRRPRRRGAARWWGGACADRWLARDAHDADRDPAGRADRNAAGRGSAAAAAGAAAAPLRARCGARRSTRDMVVVLISGSAWASSFP